MVVKPGFELGLTKSKIVPCWDVWSCDGDFAVMEALYTIDLIRHLPLSRHSDLVLQLHGISSVLAVGYISLLLWLLMMHAMFGMQL